MPNGRRLKQNLPNGVIKVVRRADSLASGICQNPELASNFVNTLAPANWAKVCSTAGRGCHSLQTLSFRRVRSTHIRTFPSGFGTTTIPEHQSVGSWMHLTTPSLSIRSSSALTFGSIGITTRLELIILFFLRLFYSLILIYPPYYSHMSTDYSPIILKLSPNTILIRRRLHENAPASSEASVSV